MAFSCLKHWEVITPLLHTRTMIYKALIMFGGRVTILFPKLNYRSRYGTQPQNQTVTIKELSEVITTLS